MVQLLLLYGTPYIPSLYRHFAQRLDGLWASLVFAGIMALTVLLIRAWAALLEGRRIDPSWVRGVLTAVCLLVLMR